ncbi:MAG TPA: cyclodeaminase/cyclohydrolase family protein [Thermoanaerobacterales bacterium]|nr:cyclodeaminase/cyclohydrolase family protein [Thermoanaerobacterales bacterium]
MVNIADSTINDFLNRLNSTAPTPGGGSAAALTSAVAAGLCGMTAKMTVGKKGYESVEENMKGCIKEIDKLIQELKQLIDEDTQAFEKVLDAYKLPKANKESAALREKAVQEALIGAAFVPLKIGEKSLKVIEIALLLSEEGNKNVITDGAAAVFLAYAAVEVSIINARINNASIKDDEVKEQIENSTIRLENKAKDLKDKLYPILERRI